MAQCKKCGETLRFFDLCCRKCGEKRESLPYGTVNESESDFAVHSERYTYSGSSLVGQNF